MTHSGKVALDALARSLAERAPRHSGRSAETIYGGHDHRLRQTLIALSAGSRMSEHVSPGPATALVWSGRIRILVDSDATDVRSGDLMILPSDPHAVEALEDSVLLLTVVKESAPEPIEDHLPGA